LRLPSPSPTAVPSAAATTPARNTQHGAGTASPKTSCGALRASVIDDIIIAGCHDAPTKHLKLVVQVLDLVDARLGINT
jgi:hypothetical protein